ncbi:hypothetical protein HDE_05352 [Halotydeus destructor]|nr:hypothetical protein HDE_05352 [Halotydeus destructor]
MMFAEDEPLNLSQYSYQDNAELCEEQSIVEDDVKDSTIASHDELIQVAFPALTELFKSDENLFYSDDSSLNSSVVSSDDTVTSYFDFFRDVKNAEICQAKANARQRSYFSLISHRHKKKNEKERRQLELKVLERRMRRKGRDLDVMYEEAGLSLLNFEQSEFLAYSKKSGIPMHMLSSDGRTCKREKAESQQVRIQRKIAQNKIAAVRWRLRVVAKDKLSIEKLKFLNHLQKSSKS